MIKGNKAELVPASLDDKQRVYEWCFHSEMTKSHSGPPVYPEHPAAAAVESLGRISRAWKSIRMEARHLGRAVFFQARGEIQSKLAIVMRAL